MKRGILITVFAAFMAGLVYGQANNQNIAGTIWFYRLPNYAGSAAGMTILIDGLPLIKLKNGAMYSHEISPGEHYISSRMGEVSTIKLIVEPGKTYYAKCFINQGMWSAIPIIELVEQIAGKAIIEGGTLSLQEFQPISTEKPKSRIGGIFGGGFGFEKILMGYTTENDELNLSTGGGVALGAEYGYQAGKFFDISVSAIYNSSMLTPPVDNADAFFRRLSLMATPAVIIPVKNKDYLTFRLGAGPSLHALGTMKIKGDEAGWETLLFKYKPAFGFHASLIFEAASTDNGSFTMGVRPYFIYYSYTAEGSTGVSTEPKINNPKGSGLDFIFGYFYRF